MADRYPDFLRILHQASIPIHYYVFNDLFLLNSINAQKDGDMKDELIDDIVGDLNEELIPWDYIDLAIVTGLDGTDREVRGEELLSLLSHPSIEEIALSVQVLIDRKRLKVDIVEAINTFWKEVLNDNDDE